jgi:peptidoglycan/LPS O-acetylase OafA/YrhL
MSIYVKLDLSKNTKIFFNFLGTISYPIYIFHFPLYLFLYYLGFRDSYLFVSLVILLCVPINYIFDDLLKKIFWKPLVNKIEKQISELKTKKIMIKTFKA